MKITEMNNLWVGRNEEEDFNILICANEEKEAQKIADDYAKDTDLEGKFIICDFDIDTRIDCDYIVTE